jgi:hypothetical protein
VLLRYWHSSLPRCVCFDGTLAAGRRECVLPILLFFPITSRPSYRDKVFKRTSTASISIIQSEPYDDLCSTKLVASIAALHGRLILSLLPISARLIQHLGSSKM